MVFAIKNLGKKHYKYWPKKVPAFPPYYGRATVYYFN